MNKNTIIACSTPYTVLNAVNYCIGTHDENVDIFISAFSPSVKEIAVRIKDIGLFNEVYEVKDIRRLKFFSIFLLLSFIFPSYVMKHIGMKQMKEKKYSKIISQNFLFISLLSKIGRKADCYLIEEGLSTYAGRARIP